MVIPLYRFAYKVKSYARAYSEVNVPATSMSRRLYLFLGSAPAVIVFGASRSAILAGFLAGSVSAQAPAKPAEVVKPAPHMAGHLAGCTVAKPRLP